MQRPHILKHLFIVVFASFLLPKSKIGFEAIHLLTEENKNEKSDGC